MLRINTVADLALIVGICLRQRLGHNARMCASKHVNKAKIKLLPIYHISTSTNESLKVVLGNTEHMKSTKIRVSVSLRLFIWPDSYNISLEIHAVSTNTSLCILCEYLYPSTLYFLKKKSKNIRAVCSGSVRKYFG